MKKTYENLQMEVIVFDKKDIVTASAEHDNLFQNISVFSDFESFFLK